MIGDKLESLLADYGITAKVAVDKSTPTPTVKVYTTPEDVRETWVLAAEVLAAVDCEVKVYVV